MKALDKELQDFMEEVQKSILDDDDSQAETIAKSEDGSDDDTIAKAAKADDDMEDDEDDEDEDEEEMEKMRKKKKSSKARKSVAADIDDDFDTEFMSKSAGFDDDEDEYTDAAPLLEGMFKSLSANQKLIAEQGDENAESIEILKSAVLTIGKAVAKQNKLLAKMAVQPANGGRRSNTAGSATETDMAKAQTFDKGLYERYLSKASDMIETGSLNAHNIATVEACRNQRLPLVQARIMHPEVFGKIERVLTAQ